MDFEKELAILINKYSKENESDTPDFILALYLKCCLANYNETVRAREAALYKECADRAVEWVNKNLCDEHMPIMYKRLEENELRSAIEGNI